MGKELPHAMADVIIRHTCDGWRTVEDTTERRMVYARRNNYHIKLYTREWPVTRISDTNMFICEFAGRTTANKIEAE